MTCLCGVNLTWCLVKLLCCMLYDVSVLCLTEAIPIPTTQPLTKIKDLDEVTIPTMEIKVNSEPSPRDGSVVSLWTLARVIVFNVKGFNPVSLHVALLQE